MRAMTIIMLFAILSVADANADVLLTKLKHLPFILKKEVHIIESDCLNNCGGGVTIQLSTSHEMIKVRSPNNLPDQVNEFLKS